MKLRAGMAAALLVLLAAKAPAQFVIGPPPPPPPGFGGYRVVYKIVLPPQRITINNYVGNQPVVLGPGFEADTRGVDLDHVPYKKLKPGTGTEALPEPSKPLPGV